MSARIITLTSAPHAKARIDSIDAATGVCVFSYLNSGETQIDSGRSIARFTPTESEPGVFVEPDDAALATAIANPPADTSIDPTPLGTRKALTGSFHHSEISSSSGATKLGDIPPGWAPVDFQARVDEAFDPGRTISVGTAASPGRWVNGLSVSTVGFKQATPIQLYPQSAANPTAVYIRKSAATTVGEIINVSLLIERKYG